MSLFYRLAYWLGVKPWEEMATLPIAAQVKVLLDREGSDHQTQRGSALDLGCGTGIWTVELAWRGWQVTGIDLVGKAVRAARRRVHEAGVTARIVQGDMTALRAEGVGSRFQLVLDLGALHGLSASQRRATADEIDAVAAPRATLLLLAWTPARRGPLPRGMGRDEIRKLFAGWELIDEAPGDTTGAPAFVRRAEPRFYRLRKA